MGKLVLHMGVRMLKKLVGATIIALSLSLSAYAQDFIDESTREVDRPVFEEVEKKLEEPIKALPKAKKEKKPEEIKEDSVFFIKKVNLVGCESFLPEEFKDTIKKYENKELGLKRLNMLTKEIEREYLAKGVVSACFLLPQEIKKGVVTLQVVEAKLGKVNIQPHKYFNNERFDYYWDIGPGDVLRHEQISNSLQLLNQNPDRKVKATLNAGKKPKTTDVYLDVETRLPVHLTASFNKEGVVSTGKKKVGLGLRHNNFLGLDDSILCGSTFGKDFSSIYAYHTIPISNFGTSLLYGGNYNKSYPKKDFADSEIRSHTLNSSIFLYQDLFRKDEYTGEVYFGLDLKDKTTTTKSTGTYNRDRLRILRLGSKFIKKGFGSVTYIKPELSHGIDLFGSRPKHDLSSRDAKSNFTKTNLKINHKRLLPFFNLQTNIKLAGQLSSTKLTPQEQYFLGGMDSVRGYPAGDYLADNALQTNFEVLIPSFFIPKKLKLPYAEKPLRDTTTSLVFFDYGRGRKRSPKDTENKVVHLSSVGAGLRTQVFNQALLRLEWGFPIANEPFRVGAESRFHFSLDLEDRFPEEIERLLRIKDENNIKHWAWKLLDEEFNNPKSPLRENLHNNFTLAQDSHYQNEPEKAKSYSEKVIETGNSIYQQGEDYVESCLEHQKELREYSKVALQFYREGDLDRAKEMWEKIIVEAKIRPLKLKL